MATGESGPKKRGRPPKGTGEGASDKAASKRASKASKAAKGSASDAVVGFEETLWQMADKLRNNMDAAEYKHVVLGLIFLKYISDAFEEKHAELVAEQASGADPEDQDEYKAENIFWVPKEARWSHLQANAKLPTIGKLIDEAKAPSLIPSDPAQGLEIGADDGGAVGDYKSPLGFTGMIDEVRLYHAALSDDEISDHASTTDRTPTDDRRLVLACTFEGGTAEDVSGNGHDGELASALSTKGKFGRAMQFSSKQSPQASGSFVEHLWTQDVPLMVRAMVKANDKLFIAGPPDLIDEEDTFQRTMARDPNLASQLSQQDEALSGKSGGLMRVVSAADGSTLAEYKLDTLPAWDGMAAANGRLYLSTTDGSVICYAGE